MNIDQKAIEEAIIKDSVEQIVQQFDTESRVESAIKEKATAIIKESVEKQLASILQAGFASMVFPSTNGYGEKKGPDKTLMEFVGEMILTHLNETVDYQGKACTDHYSTKEPRLHWLVRKSAEKQIEEAVKSAASIMRDNIAKVMGNIVEREVQAVIAKLK